MKISSDKEQRALYEMRQKTLHDEANALDSAREEGEMIKAIEIAKNLLDVLDDDTISLKTGLSINEVKRLRE